MKEIFEVSQKERGGVEGAQAQLGPQESQTNKQKRYTGGQVHGWPNWWAGGSGGCGAQRGGVRRASRSPLPELQKLAGALEGTALRAAPAKVRVAVSAPGAASA